MFPIGAQKAAAVTPSDSTSFLECCALYVGTSGDVTAVVNGVAVLFKTVPVGVLPVRATRVNATGTTAANIVALY